MARNFSPGIPDDELASRTLAFESSRSQDSYEDPDPRLLDLEEEVAPSFHRARTRVPVRKGALPRKAAERVKTAFLVLILLGCSGVLFGEAYRYGTRSWRFSLNSSDHIEMIGARNVSRGQILQV